MASPPLSLDIEAVELFVDRARKVSPGFQVIEDNSVAVTEICHRLDGMPLAIELAAARMRAMSVDEILASLHDRFRLLTGGARTAVRRQQTLRASVDWSHALLTEPERVLFRHLAAFMGGFNLDAAEAVCGGGHVERYQVLDELTLLVDKSLVVAETNSSPTRYRILETIRQYGLEKLGESGDADAVRGRHRDYFLSVATALDRPERTEHEGRLDQAELEIDNLRSAFVWSRESGDSQLALTFAASLQPLWLARGRSAKGLHGSKLRSSRTGLPRPLRSEHERSPTRRCSNRGYRPVTPIKPRKRSASRVTSATRHYWHARSPQADASEDMSLPARSRTSTKRWNLRGRSMMRGWSARYSVGRPTAQ